MHSDGEDYYEIYTFLYHPPSEHPLEHGSGTTGGPLIARVRYLAAPELA